MGPILNTIIGAGIKLGCNLINSWLEQKRQDQMILAARDNEMLQAMIDKSQKNVNGVVRLKIYKGNVTILGRKSDSSLYSTEMATFEEDSVYDQKDAEGFIKLNALRLKLLKNIT